MNENPETQAPTEPALPSAVVDRCVAAYKDARRDAAGQGASDYKQHEAGRIAYRLAMPRTNNLADIHAFIACVACGITLEIFDRHEPTQLLYAAQVALAAVKGKPKKK